MKEKLLNALIAVLLLVSVSGTAVWIYGKVKARSALAANADTPAGASVANWRAIAANGTIIRKGQSGPTILVFSDYQCPYCLVLEKSIDSLWRNSHQGFSEVLRHYPLRIHEYAEVAALAIECVGDSVHVLALHQSLYAHSQTLNRSAIRDLLAEAMPAAERPAALQCFDGAARAQRVTEDLALARSLKLGGTPAFIIDGKLYYGGYHPDSLRALLGLNRSPSH